VGRFASFKQKATVAGLAVILALAPGLLAAADAVFQPVIPGEGQAWLVRAVYRSALDREKWSEPVTWRFLPLPSREAAVPGGTAVEVRDAGGRLDQAARLEFSGSRSLVRADLTQSRRGKAVTFTLEYPDGTPAVAEKSLVPFDFPAFPAQVPSVRTYRREIAAGGGLYREVLLAQEVREVTNPGGVPPLLRDRKLIEIRVTGEDGREIFTQYWEEGRPFCLFGRNADMEYGMVTE